MTPQILLLTAPLNSPQASVRVRPVGPPTCDSCSPWRDGTKAFLFDPLIFIERLVAILPHPREHQLTYHGVFAPASSLRHLIVPRPSALDPEHASCHKSPTPADPPEPPTKLHTGSSTYRWPELIARVFGEDVLLCPNCHGHRTLLAAITDPFAIRRILAHFGLPTEVIPLEPPRPPPQPDLPWETYGDTA